MMWDLQGWGKDSPCYLPTVQQEEQDFHLSPNIIASAGADDIPYPRAPSHASTWGSVLDGFPPAWPLPDDLSRYCSGPSLIPRAPRPSLPPAAFAHLRRQVAALDSFWPRLDSCCQHHAPLPCARRAVSLGSCHQGGAHRAGVSPGGGGHVGVMQVSLKVTQVSCRDPRCVGGWGGEAGIWEGVRGVPGVDTDVQGVMRVPGEGPICP